METKFYLVTDTHYFAHSLGCYGEAYENRMQFEQKCFAENQAINEAVFDWLINEANEADTVLFAGDLSFNGEKESHKGILELFKKLKASGKKVYVITAGHDFNENPPAYDDTGVHPVEGTKREELYEMYYDYGFSDAIAVDKESLSYVAQLSDGVRLLAMNCDGDEQGEYKHTFTARQLDWFKEQIEKAKKDGQVVIGMTHYPLLPACPVFSLLGGEVVMRHWDENTSKLADWGMNLCFTGHMHNQSIKHKTSPAGNVFYDCCTGSVTGDPAKMRIVSITDGHEVKIDSIPVPDFKWNMQGLTTEEYYKRQFDMMIKSYVEAMENDPAKFLGKLGVKNANDLLKKIVAKAGKKLNRATLGGMAKVLHIKCGDSIKTVLFKDFAVDLVRQIFEGDPPYFEGTPEREFAKAALGKLRPIMKIVNKKVKVNGQPADMGQIILESMGSKDSCDNKAEFTI